MMKNVYNAIICGKIVKGILFGVWTCYKLYFGLENITEKDQLTRYAAL